MANSNIEWTEYTWNFVTGCDKVSTGCKHCYAEIFSKRLKAMGQAKYSNGFQLTLHEDALGLPLNWKKPRIVFVNSMSDLFHEEVPIELIKKAFAIMKKAHWHQFQILTKRSTRLVELSTKIEWPSNVWMGVSVEKQDYDFRIEDLRQTRAKIKFLSLEPLLGPLPYLNLDKIDWVIVGGESGFNARPLKMEWVIEIRNICQQQEIPFFFKQWGGVNKKKNGRILEGRTWDEYPKFSSRHEGLSLDV